MKNKDKLIIALLKEQLSKLTNKKVVLQEEIQTETFIPEKALSDENEPRPNRMKRPGQLPGGWQLFRYSQKGGTSGLYIQDECRDMMIDKYGTKGEKVWEGLIDAGTGPFFSFATQVAAEKRWLINELGLTYNPSDYWQYSYFSMWKEWMKRIGKSVDIKQPESIPTSALKPSIDTNQANDPIPTKQTFSTDYSKIKPGDKDETRISDIARKAAYDPKKMKDLATQMANKITDGEKAYRRGLAAESENYHDIAEIFFNRAKRLGFR